MASLPGMPGNLGLPAGTGPIQPSGSGSGSDLSLDLPTPVAEGLSFANATFITTVIEGHPNENLSGSVTIPATTAGNLVIVILSPVFWPDNTPPFDAHYDIHFSLDVNTGETPIVIPNGGDEDFDTFAQNSGIRSWYFVTVGGTTTLNWTATGYPTPDAFGQNGPAPNFWVYEVAGSSDWALAQSARVYAVDSGDTPTFLPPWTGPELTGTALHNIYFVAAWRPDANLKFLTSWIPDPFSSTYHLANFTIGYILDGFGTQQAQYDRDPGGDESAFGAYLSYGFVFSATAESGPPPTGDLDQFLPNIWIVS